MLPSAASPSPRTGRCAIATAMSSTRVSTTSACGRPTTTSASARPMRSGRFRSRAGSSLAALRSAKRSMARVVDKGFGVAGRVQSPVAPQRGAHRAVLPQWRRAHASSGRRAVRPGRQCVSRQRTRRHGHRAAGRPSSTLSSDEIDALVALPGDAHRRPGRLSSARRSIIRSSSCLTDIQETPTQPPTRTAMAWPTMCWSKSRRSAPGVAIRFRAFSKGFSGRPLIRDLRRQCSVPNRVQ